MSSDQLTEYQRLLIDQFKSITADSSSSISEEEAISLLRSQDWNLELSIIEYYQSNPLSQTDFVSAYTDSIIMNSNNRSIMSRISSAFGNSSSPLLPGGFPDSESSPSKIHQFLNKFVYYLIVMIQFVLILPLLVIFKVIGYLLVLVIDKLVPIFNKIFGLRLSSSTYYAKKNLTNPTERSRRFIYEFDEFINNKPLLDTVTSDIPQDGIRESNSSLMEISRPNFLECSYTNALYLLKKEFKWLMIYIQSDEHEDKLQFIQQVLLNEQFLAFLRNNEIVVWGGNMKESESYQVANNFNISGVPFLGLIALTSEDSASAPQVTLVSKIQGITYNIMKPDGSINTPKIINKFHSTIERLNPNLVALRTEAQQRESSRSIRAQQDLAYQRSLALDIRREEERTREIERQRAEQGRALAAETLRLNKLKWLTIKYSDLLQRESQLPMTDKKETSRIAIRLPDGQRIQHTFHKSFKVEDLYIYADAVLNKVTESSPEDSQMPSSYTHEFNFKLISVMPRAEITLDSSQSIGGNNLVYPSGNLVMEENDD